jgi:MFS family permease
MGMVLGYIMTAVLVVNLNWKWSFYVQAVALFPIAITFVLYPRRYTELQQVPETPEEQGCTGSTKRRLKNFDIIE